MGRYFGIGNNTKNHVVSGYWKSDDFCDCHEVMHQLHWEVTDDIYSRCCDTYNEIKYCKSSTTMEISSPEEDSDSIEKDEDIIVPDNNDSIEKEFEKNEENTEEPLKFGFEPEKESQQISNHAPIWEGNKCTHCGYVYDPKIMEKAKERFDSIFFMN